MFLDTTSDRSRRVTVRLTEREYFEFETYAKQNDMGVSTYIRTTAICAEPNMSHGARVLNILDDEFFREKLCMSIAIQLINGSVQMPKEHEDKFYSLARRLEDAIKCHTE